MDELQQLQLQIAELQKRAKEITQQNKAKVVAEIKETIALYGITAVDLGLSATPVATEASNGSKTTRAPAAIKYRNGDLTWTGRGRKPMWLEELIKNGGSLNDYLVQT